MEQYRFRGEDLAVPHTDLDIEDTPQGEICLEIERREGCRDILCEDCIFHGTNYSAYISYIKDEEVKIRLSFGDSL